MSSTLITTFGAMCKMMLTLLKWPVILFFVVLIVFYLDCLFWYYRRYRKGDRVQRGSVRPLVKRPALLRIFVDAPRQYVDDLYNRKPDFFNPQGLIVFTGRQGNGKSAALFQYAMELHDQYPLAKCISNTKYCYQDKALTHWSQLTSYKNTHKGVIVILDELQNWFSSNMSRNFPPEMLSVITQNRKNRRVILGTAQNFYLLAKPIRSQCTEIRECLTLAGCLTIVVKREPIVDNDGDVKEMKYRGIYFFAHSRRLREAYDTWSIVDNLMRSGFHDNPLIKDDSVNIEITNKKK